MGTTLHRGYLDESTAESGKDAKVRDKNWLNLLDLSFYTFRDIERDCRTITERVVVLWLYIKTKWRPLVPVVQATVGTLLVY